MKPGLSSAGGQWPPLRVGRSVLPPLDVHHAVDVPEFVHHHGQLLQSLHLKGDGKLAAAAGQILAEDLLHADLAGGQRRGDI